MTIYTSYFGKIKDLPDKIFPISIADVPPVNLRLPEYRGFAPTKEIRKNWYSNHDQEEYLKDYKSHILDTLTPEITMYDLLRLSGIKRVMDDKYGKSAWTLKDLEKEGLSICLVCFEKSGDFCHRYNAAHWLVIKLTHYGFNHHEEYKYAEA